MLNPIPHVRTNDEQSTVSLVIDETQSNTVGGGITPTTELGKHQATNSIPVPTTPKVQVGIAIPTQDNGGTNGRTLKVTETPKISKAQDVPKINKTQETADTSPTKPRLIFGDEVGNIKSNIPKEGSISTPKDVENKQEQEPIFKSTQQGVLDKEKEKAVQRTEDISTIKTDVQSKTVKQEEEVKKDKEVKLLFNENNFNTTPSTPLVDNNTNTERVFQVGATVETPSLYKSKQAQKNNNKLLSKLKNQVKKTTLDNNLAGEVKQEEKTEVTVDTPKTQGFSDFSESYINTEQPKDSLELPKINPNFNSAMPLMEFADDEEEQVKPVVANVNSSLPFMGGGIPTIELSDDEDEEEKGESPSPVQTAVTNNQPLPEYNKSQQSTVVRGTEVEQEVAKVQPVAPTSSGITYNFNGNHSPINLYTAPVNYYNGYTGEQVEEQKADPQVKQFNMGDVLSATTLEELDKATEGLNEVNEVVKAKRLLLEAQSQYL